MMKRLRSPSGIGIIAVAFVCALAGSASADPIPLGYTCTGNCGTLGADGVVVLSPYGNASYAYVTTSGGLAGAGQLSGVGGINGSLLQSPLFAANAGDALSFYFNYITSDGSGYADYAWAKVVDSSFSDVALLFTARTQPSGSIIPGFGLPAPTAGVTLTPLSQPIIPGGPLWSPLGTYSGACWDVGCGYTGWVLSSYAIPTAGSYYVQFGVSNWDDNAYDSGMAFDGITVAGEPITPPPDPIPEPSTLLLMSLGLIGLRAAKRRRG